MIGRFGLSCPAGERVRILRKLNRFLRRFDLRGLQRVPISLARGTNAREALTVQLERFFDCIEQVLASGNSSWLNATVLERTSSPTLSDLQQQKNSAGESVNKIISITNEVALENLGKKDALKPSYHRNPHLYLRARKDRSA